MADELRDISPETLAWANHTSVQIMESVTIDSEWPIPVNLRNQMKRYPARDLRGFFELVNTTLTDFQDRCNTVEAERVSFVEEGPPTDFKNEVITFKVLERRPGAHSGRLPDILGNDDSVVREWRPRIRYVTKDATRPLQSIMVMGQKFDNVVEFTCWAKTNKAVDARALWFEEFMDARHWYYKYMGVEEIVFKQRLADKYWEDTRTSGNLLKSRSMHYYVRTDRTFEISASTLRDLLVNIAVGVG